MNNVTSDLIFKILGIAVAFVGQGIVVYSSIVSKFENVQAENTKIVERIVDIEKKIIERERYIEAAGQISKDISDIKEQLREAQFQELNMFKRVNDLELKVERHFDNHLEPKKK